MNTTFVTMTYTVAEPRVEVYAGFETASNNETRVLVPGTYPVTFDVREGGRVDSVHVAIPAIVARRHMVNRVFTASSVEDPEPMEAATHHLSLYPWNVKVQPAARTKGGFAFAYVAPDEPAALDPQDADVRAMVALALAAYDDENRAKARRYERLRTLSAPFVRMEDSRWDGMQGAIVQRVSDGRGSVNDAGRELAEQDDPYVGVVWVDGTVSPAVALDALRAARYPEKGTAEATLVQRDELRDDAVKGA